MLAGLSGCAIGTSGSRCLDATIAGRRLTRAGHAEDKVRHCRFLVQSACPRVPRPWRRASRRRPLPAAAFHAADGICLATRLHRVCRGSSGVAKSVQTANTEDKGNVASHATGHDNGRRRRGNEHSEDHEPRPGGRRCAGRAGRPGAGARRGDVRHQLAGRGRARRLLSGGRRRHLREIRPQGHHRPGRPAGGQPGAAARRQDPVLHGRQPARCRSPPSSRTFR